MDKAWSCNGLREGLLGVRLRASVGWCGCLPLLLAGCPTPLLGVGSCSLPSDPADLRK